VVWGVLVAAIALLTLQGSGFRFDDWPAQLEPAKYERLVFGILLIMMMIFRPSGLLPEPRRKMEMPAAKAEAEDGAIGGGG
jgi:branched-chain amino acid transport system permease protein